MRDYEIPMQYSLESVADCIDEQIDELDSRERDEDSSQPMDRQITAQDRTGAHRPIRDPLERRRDQRDDCNCVECHRRRDDELQSRR